MRTSVPDPDLELLERYDVPAPRYTSYPTVPQFDEISSEEVVRALEDETPTDRPLSLYFHIPYCRKLCWYCACNREISKDRSVAGPYLEVLVEELDRRMPMIGGREVAQVHLGGGTPTFLPVEDLRRLGEALHERFEFVDEPELSIEIDPRQCSREQVEVLREAGFNRASMGVQDHDPEVQEAINRRQPRELTARVVRWLRDAGFGSVNFDLVYGLPRQTESSFARTLRDLLELQPDRLAIYSYAHVPWKHPAQKLLEDAGIPDGETKLRLLKRAIADVTDAGYQYIGLDHFARPDDDLAVARREGRLHRNFQGYTTRDETDVHAFGVSGISQTETTYFQNLKEIEPYRQCVGDEVVPVLRGYRLSDEDRLRRRIIQDVMCEGRVEFDAFEEAHGIEFERKFGDEIAAMEPLERDGLVRVTDRALEVTPTGRLFLRHVASRFDEYFDPDDGRFSKTV